METRKINIAKILKENKKIKPSELAKNLKILGELQKNGVNIGPDYQLGSPYSRPDPRSSRPNEEESILKSG
ncbi:MAG: hypothetical protein JW709_05305 [Sedimentisphaerales bacterium]|nr:hypothetical protein [Sedimentisphaerales bacterium]